MSDNHEPIPQRSKLVEPSGLISNVWHRFLYAIFGDIYKKLQDHEDRITNLEP